jgi:hypothetical protein
MVAVYGRPAIEVEQPTGDVVPYLVRVCDALPDEWAAWVVTSPEGNEYRVTEFPNGTVRCSCPAFRWNRHGAGRWCDADGKPVCKHAGSVHSQIIKPSEELSRD